MPEPVGIALIAAIGGIIGGVIAAFARPWGQDYVNRMADERATRRARVEQRIHRIERVIEILAMSGLEGSSTYSAEKGSRELPAATAAVGDSALSEFVGRMNSAGRRSIEGNSARTDAATRAGELLREADDELQSI